MTANPVRYERRDAVAIIAMESGPSNCLTHAARSALVLAIDRVQADGAIRVAVLTGTPDTFSMGSDIRDRGTPRDAAAPTLRTLIDVVERSPKPIVAAVGGACLGEGLELALGCHYRVASPRAELGFPAIKLGLIPAAGGTQRFPRLVGIERALSLLLSGTSVPAARFAGTLLFDALVDGDVLAAAVAFAEELVREPRPARLARTLATDPGKADALFQFVRASAASSKPTRASQKCVDAVEAAARRPFSEGLAFERERFEELAAGGEWKALRHVLLAERSAADITGVAATTPIRPVHRVGIVGAGTMGAGIATTFLAAGIPVVLLESRKDALDRGVAVVRGNFEAMVKRERLGRDEAQRALSGLAPALEYDALRDSDLFLEAVFEDLAVKEQVFRRLDEMAKPGAILATNTSTLNVDRIASFTSRPSDVLGMHFFSPAHVMKLLEVVRGAATSDRSLATVLALARSIGKTAVVSGVCDGFIGNRMLQAYLRQAFFLLDDGALPSDVDGALERFGMAMGPFRVGDLAGNDIGWAVRKRLRVERPERAYSRIPDRLCEQGRLGQKTGKGWYRYEVGSRDATVDPEVTRLIEAYRAEHRIVPRRIADDEIVERCILALVNEGARILEEGIAQRASDVDLVYLTGYGFPRARGGPMFYADTLGAYVVARAMRSFAAEPKAASRGDAEFWTPAPFIEKMLAEGRTFSGGDDA